MVVENSTETGCTCKPEFGVTRGDCPFHGAEPDGVVNKCLDCIIKDDKIEQLKDNSMMMMTNIFIVGKCDKCDGVGRVTQKHEFRETSYQCFYCFGKGKIRKELNVFEALEKLREYAGGDEIRL